jgi:hypothetical protein
MNDVLTPIPDDEPRGPLSILEQLQAEAESAASAVEGASLKLLVPGYKLLYVGFHYVPRASLTKFRKKYKGMPVDQIELMASVDLLAATCEQFYFSDDGETYTSVQEAANADTPVRFDDALRRLVLKLEPIKNASQTVRDVYLDNDYTIIDVAEKVVEWLKDTTRDNEDTLLGG